MKPIIITLILLSCLLAQSCFGQSNTQTKKDKSANQKLVGVFPKETKTSKTKLVGVFPKGNKTPETKKEAISGIKVLNRHGAKFYYNDSEISFKEAKKLARTKFDKLLIIEDWSKEVINITDKNDAIHKTLKR